MVTLHLKEAQGEAPSRWIRTAYKALFSDTRREAERIVYLTKVSKGKAAKQAEAQKLDETKWRKCGGDGVKGSELKQGDLTSRKCGSNN